MSGMNRKNVKKLNPFIMLVNELSKNIINITKGFIVTNHTSKINSMEPINKNVAGIDIGAYSIFICAGLENGQRPVREYLTFTADLKAAAVWLGECGVKSVAMESTGSYWISTYEILEDAGFEVLLVNAHHLRTVPGRKTDVKDCQWIQQLHSFGLLRGSFRPNSNGVTLRTYVRQRCKLVELGSTQIHLMTKALIQMNIRLDEVFSEISGVSSLAIIRAILAGERDPNVLVKFRNVRCKKTVNEVIKSLDGNYLQEHLFSLKQSLDAYDFIHTQLVECDAEIQKFLEDLEGLKGTVENSEELEVIDNKIGKTKKKKNKKNSYSFDAGMLLKKHVGVDLTDIPGIDANLAMKIIAEIGSNVDSWKTAKNFTSWLGLCPGNKISGGKVLSSKTIPIVNRAKQAFLLAANTLYRSETALGGFFRRMRAKLGTPKAITATAHKIAKIVYHMINTSKSYKDIGQEAYENKFKQRRLANLKRMASEMGFSLQALEEPESQVA